MENLGLKLEKLSTKAIEEQYEKSVKKTNKFLNEDLINELIKRAEEGHRFYDVFYYGLGLNEEVIKEWCKKNNLMYLKKSSSPWNLRIAW